MSEGQAQRKIIIAIDGPAASGKSTTARLLARHLGYTYINTGAMYRAVAYKAIVNDVVEQLQNDEKALSEFLESTDVLLKGEQVFLDGNDISQEIYENQVSNVVSQVSSLKQVRAKLLDYQRQMGEKKAVVMDGRDIGTVVFPQAELKIFMIADAHERAKRRYKELSGKSCDCNPGITLEELEEEIRQRDEDDRNRKEAPLKKPEDAVELDTSHLTIKQQVEKISEMAKAVIESSEVGS
jgi:cytidylate kinase